MSAFWPGIANSRSGTRPSLFRPMSITARSFSIAVTVPLTTRPSKPPSAPPSDSSSIAAKSSRVGKAVVAMDDIPYFICSGQAVGSAGLVADPPRPPDAERSIVGTVAGEGRAKQKGRDREAPSRPTLLYRAAACSYLDRLKARQTRRVYGERRFKARRKRARG